MLYSLKADFLRVQTGAITFLQSVSVPFKHLYEFVCYEVWANNMSQKQRISFTAYWDSRLTVEFHQGEIHSTRRIKLVAKHAVSRSGAMSSALPLFLAPTPVDRIFTVVIQTIANRIEKWSGRVGCNHSLTLESLNCISISE
jgi:hypothetical protein